MMLHAEAAELLAAYALDAVEPDEAEQIEAHLENCPRCRSELQSHREVVGLLAYSGHDAPEGLWDQVAARIHETEEGEGPGPLRLVTGVSPSGAQRSPAGGTEIAVGAAAGGPSAGSTGFRVPRRPAAGRGGGDRVAGRGVRWLSLATAAAVVVIALLGVEVGRLQSRTDHLSRQVATMSYQVTMADVKSALATPGARSVQLRSPAGGGVQLDAVILPGGTGYLYNSNLSPLAPDRTYQLWGVVGTQVISYGVLGPTLQGIETFRASAGVSALAVTDEVAGGVVSSTQAPVAVGTIA